jgi:hypothetical protein
MATQETGTSGDQPGEVMERQSWLSANVDQPCVVLQIEHDLQFAQLQIGFYWMLIL